MKPWRVYFVISRQNRKGIQLFLFVLNQKFYNVKTFHGNLYIALFFQNKLLFLKYLDFQKKEVWFKKRISKMTIVFLKKKKLRQWYIGSTRVLWLNLWSRSWIVLDLLIFFCKLFQFNYLIKIIACKIKYQLKVKTIVWGKPKANYETQSSINPS